MNIIENIIGNIQKDYITKAEFCEMCNISKSTGYKLIKTGKVHFEQCRDGLLHFYKIPLSEVERYKQEIARKGILTGIKLVNNRWYYEKKLIAYNDIIDAQDIRTITGYGKEIIRKWINSEKILGVVVRKRFKVAKDDLIDFLLSPYYQNIIRKSNTHKEDMKRIKLL